jgi:hypothetical protein
VYQIERRAPRADWLFQPALILLISSLLIER